jgi:hypothetical protein
VCFDPLRDEPHGAAARRGDPLGFGALTQQSFLP